MKTCDLYLRVSRKQQTTDNQVPILEAYAKENGWQIRNVYSESVSAYMSGRQVVLKGLIESYQLGRFNRPDILLVFDLSRLSRQGIRHVQNLIESFDTMGVQLSSYSESWTMQTGIMRELLFAVFSWAAMYESKIKSERTNAGLDRARAEGKKLGRPKGSKDTEKRNRRGYLLRYANKPKKGGAKIDTKDKAVRV